MLKNKHRLITLFLLSGVKRKKQIRSPLTRYFPIDTSSIFFKSDNKHLWDSLSLAKELFNVREGFAGLLSDFSCNNQENKM